MHWPQKFLPLAAILLVCTTGLIYCLEKGRFEGSLRDNSKGRTNPEIVLAQFQNGPATNQNDRLSPRTQFTSFLYVQQHPDISPDTDSDIDPDWTQEGKSANGEQRLGWSSKADLNLKPGDDSSCPVLEAQATTPTNSMQKPQGRTAARFEIPPQLKSSGNTGPSLAGTNPDCDGVLQSVRYNGVASAYVLNWKLNEIQNMDQMVGKQSIDFPDGSIIYKALWEKVGQSAGQNPVWDPGNTLSTGPINSGLGSPSAGNSTWPTAITIAPEGDCDSGNYWVQGDFGATQDKPKVARVPISCFWHSDSNYVLVGVNIAHKSNKVWYWYTFAWTNFNTPPQPGSAAVQVLNRLYNFKTWAPSGWSHYLMNTTNGASDPIGTPVVFNPYLEGINANGVISNCIRCHQYAAYVASSQLGSPGAPLNGRPFKIGIDQAHGRSPKAVLGETVSNDLKGTLSTDFLWSLVSGNGETN